MSAQFQSSSCHRLVSQRNSLAPDKTRQHRQIPRNLPQPSKSNGLQHYCLSPKHHRQCFVRASRWLRHLRGRIPFSHDRIGHTTSNGRSIPSRSCRRNRWSFPMHDISDGTFGRKSRCFNSCCKQLSHDSTAYSPMEYHYPWISWAEPHQSCTILSTDFRRAGPQATSGLHNHHDGSHRPNVFAILHLRVRIWYQ